MGIETVLNTGRTDHVWYALLSRAATVMPGSQLLTLFVFFSGTLLSLLRILEMVAAVAAASPLRGTVTYYIEQAVISLE